MEPMARGGLWASLALAIALGGAAAEARADVWSRTDAEGIVHFTNVRPRGPDRGKWKLVLRENRPPAKVVARRGACERCDRVPARDRSPERYSRFDAHIREAAALYAIPEALIRAVIKVESDYDPRVVSVFGARGLMQLMPAVIEEMGVTDPHDPRQNILGGTRLLRVLANTYDGDLVRTIAAYHAGRGSLARYGGDVPPYYNTRRYLNKVIETYRRYRRADGRALAGSASP